MTCYQYTFSNVLRADEVHNLLQQLHQRVLETVLRRSEALSHSLRSPRKVSAIENRAFESSSHLQTSLSRVRSTPSLSRLGATSPEPLISPPETPRPLA